MYVLIRPVFSLDFEFTPNTPPSPDNEEIHPEFACDNRVTGKGTDGFTSHHLSYRFIKFCCVNVKNVGGKHFPLLVGKNKKFL